MIIFFSRKHDLAKPPKLQCITCGFLCETEEIASKHKAHMGEVNGSHLIEPFDNILTELDETSLNKEEKGKIIMYFQATLIDELLSKILI